LGVFTNFYILIKIIKNYKLFIYLEPFSFYHFYVAQGFSPAAFSPLYQVASNHNLSSFRAERAISDLRCPIALLLAMTFSSLPPVGIDKGQVGRFFAITP